MPEMACDLGQQEPPPPWHAAAVGALEQPRLRLILDAPGRERASRRRLHVASRGAVVLVAMLRLRRRALAEDEEQVDGVAEHALERTAKVRTPLAALHIAPRHPLRLFRLLAWPW